MIEDLLSKYDILKNEKLDYFLIFEKEMCSRDLLNRENLIRLSILKLALSGLEDFKKIINSGLLLEKDLEKIALSLMSPTGYDVIEHLCLFDYVNAAYNEGFKQGDIQEIIYNRICEGLFYIIKNGLVFLPNLYKNEKNEVIPLFYQQMIDEDNYIDSNVIRFVLEFIIKNEIYFHDLKVDLENLLDDESVQEHIDFDKINRILINSILEKFKKD